MSSDHVHTLPPGLPPDLPEHLTAYVCTLMLAGITPTVEVIGPRRWRVAVHTDRVHAEADYRAASRGRIVHLRDSLLVDGVRRPSAQGTAHLARILADPDDTGTVPGTAVADPLLPRVEASGDVTKALALLQAPSTGPAEAPPGDPASGEGFGSVGVRRHSVMRN